MDLLADYTNVFPVRQEIPLTDAEIAALDKGVAALESLLKRLADIPTPSGKTPPQIREQSLVQIEAPSVCNGPDLTGHPQLCESIDASKRLG